MNKRISSAVVLSKLSLGELTDVGRRDGPFTQPRQYGLLERATADDSHSDAMPATDEFRRAIGHCERILVLK
jgi:hypothetical protein